MTDRKRYRLPDSEKKRDPLSKRSRLGGNAKQEDEDEDDPFAGCPLSDYTWVPDRRFPAPRAPVRALTLSPDDADLELFNWTVNQYMVKQPSASHLHWLADADKPHGEGALHVIRIFGHTKAGHTVALDIHGYKPYFYCPLPSGLEDKPPEERKHLMTSIRLALEDCLAVWRARQELAKIADEESMNWLDDNGLTRPVYDYVERAAELCPGGGGGGDTIYRKTHLPAIHSVKIVERRDITQFYPPTPEEMTTNQRALEGEQVALDQDGGMRTPMLLVETYLENDARCLAKAVHHLDDGGNPIIGPRHRLSHGMGEFTKALTYECEFSLINKFLSDVGLSGCSWFRVSRSCYRIRRDVPVRQLVESIQNTKKTLLFDHGFFPNRPFAQLVANCNWRSIVPIPERVDYPDVLRVVCFDLETLTLLTEEEADRSHPISFNEGASSYHSSAGPLQDPVAGKAGKEEEEEERHERLLEEACKPNWNAPKESHAGIIQISAILYEFPKGEITHKAIFSLGPLTSAGVGPDVEIFTYGPEPTNQAFNRLQAEQLMIQEFVRYITVADPDVLTGYNVLGFDWNYLVSRAQTLGVPLLVGRTGKPLSIKLDRFESRAIGQREYMRPLMDGRISIDMRVEVERNGQKSLRSYTLNSVSLYYLGPTEKKVDVHWTQIPTLWRGTQAQRDLLARYCVKDSLLPLKILHKRKTLVSMMALARVTGLSFQGLLDKGQSQRVFQQLRSRAIRGGWVVPDQFRIYGASQGANKREKTSAYKGAAVIDPKKGFYMDWVFTYDFVSLYPSIILAFNLCYTTLVPAPWVEAIGAIHPEWLQEPDPQGNVFLKRNVRRGLLPEILETLLACRRQAKKRMQKAHDEDDPLLESICDADQLALKLQANSIYGFTGLTLGKLPCLAVAGAVTSHGRNLIMKTKNVIERVYDKWPGGEVLYGDTDSVMVKINVSPDMPVKEVIELASVGRDIINNLFREHRFLEIEFEKAFHPFLSVKKKRYAGWRYLLDRNAPDGISQGLMVKGLESQRRDNAPIVANTVTQVIERLCRDRDKTAAVKAACDAIERIYTKRVTLEELVISKALTKKTYTGKQAHAAVNEKKIRREGPGSAYRLGERVPFVVVARPRNKSGKAPLSETAEDPAYVRENNLPIDREHYIKALRAPLATILDTVMWPGFTENHIIQGQHTRRRVIDSIADRKNTKGTLASFVTVISSPQK